MDKPWRVSSPADNYEEDFATEDDALADAEKVIQLFREEAQDDGEWDEEVEFVKVHRLCHVAQVTKRVEEERGEAVEYGMVPVSEHATLPRSLTAENGAKSLMIGEFHETCTISCPECAGDEDYGPCSVCKSQGVITQKVTVSWDTIKEIYKRIVDNLSA